MFYMLLKARNTVVVNHLSINLVYYRNDYFLIWMEYVTVDLGDKMDNTETGRQMITWCGDF